MIIPPKHIGWCLSEKWYTGNRLAKLSLALLAPDTCCIFSPTGDWMAGVPLVLLLLCVYFYGSLSIKCFLFNNYMSFLVFPF